MKLSKLITLIGLAIGLSATSYAEEERETAVDINNPADIQTYVDGLVEPAMEQYHSASGVVAVMKGGEMLFAKGYGYRDIEKQLPVNPETTAFRVGSITKLFAWMSVMQLVEQGKLDLDADVNIYLTNFKIKDTYPGKPVTLRHLLTHTPGFEDGAGGYMITEDANRVIGLAESMAKYQPTRVNEPGKVTSYSNYGTALAGLIVENVSGVPFNDYVKQNIYDVLGMNHSTIDEPLPAELAVDQALAYSSDGEYTPLAYSYITNFGPAGAMTASAYDMAILAKALLNDGAYDERRILQPETLQQMLNENLAATESTGGFGLGFYWRHINNKTMFGHNGATGKYFSDFTMVPEDDLMVFVSFSGVGGAAIMSSFMQKFYSHFFPADMPAIEPPADFANRAAKYEGTYQGWRNNFTQLEGATRWTYDMKVEAMADNTLSIGGDAYVEVDSNLFRQVSGRNMVRFEETGGTIDSFVMRGAHHYFKAPFYTTKAFIQPMLIISLLVFAAVLLQALIKVWRIKQKPVSEQRNLLASVLVAVTNLAFAGLIIYAMPQGSALFGEAKGLLVVTLIFPILAVLAALYHLYQTVRVWQANTGSALSRVSYSVVTLCALFAAWFYYYWNILGFNYFS